MLRGHVVEVETLYASLVVVLRCIIAVIDHTTSLVATIVRDEVLVLYSREGENIGDGFRMVSHGTVPF